MTYFGGIKQCWLVVSNIFYFHPYLGKISILTNIFQMGWNHQPECKYMVIFRELPYKSALFVLAI